MSNERLLVTPRPPESKSASDTESRYELVENFRRAVRFEQLETDAWVPSGFRYDGASIPSFAWSFVYTPFDPRVMVGAAIHDWLYQTHRLYVHGQNTELRREQADDIMLEIMRRDSIPRRKRAMIYSAVRAGGSHAWETYSSWDCKHLRWLYEQHANHNVERFGFPDWARHTGECGHDHWD